MKPRLLVRTLFAIGAAISAGACRLVVGIEDTPTYGGPAVPPPSECGGFQYANPKCGACGIANCCEASTQCAGDAECAALVACEKACSEYDDECLLLCELQRPNAVDRARAFGACLEEVCPATCIRHVWACLEHPVTPVIAGLGPPITLTTYFYGPNGPVSGLDVRACDNLDFSCTTPLASVITEPSGRAVLALKDNFFKGYVRVSDDSGVYITSVYYLPSLSKDYTVPRILGVTTNEMLTNLLDGVGGASPDRGMLTVLTLDCIGNSSGGVQVAIEPSEGSSSFYSETVGTAAIPSKTPTQTSEGGYFFALNTQPDTPITVRATVAENGLPFPEVRVVTRPGVDTNLLLVAPR